MSTLTWCAVTAGAVGLVPGVLGCLKRNSSRTSDLFAEELARVVKDLETITQLGSPRPAERRPLLKWLLFEKTRCHVYSGIDEPKRRSES